MKKLLCTLLVAVFAIGSIHAQFGDVSGGSPTLQVIPTTSSSPGTNTPITADGTDLGTVNVGNSTSQTYTFTTLAASQYIVQTPTALTGDFAINSPTPGSISIVDPVGTTSTFSVTFEPTTVGDQTVTVHLRVIDILASPVPTAEDYYFEVKGTGGVATPELVLTGDDSVQINNFHNTSSGDNTDFGQAVANSETVSRQYTIINNGGADLSITSIDFLSSPDPHYNLVLPPGTTFPFTIPSGFSFDYDIEFSPVSIAAPLDSYIKIESDDTTIVPFFYYQVSGEGIAASPNMDVFGNSVEIADGDLSPDLTELDHTYFGDVDIKTVDGFSRIFTIENNGTADLFLTSVSPVVSVTGADASDFTVTANPTTPIATGASTTFTVRFDPSTIGLKEAVISINNNSTNGETPYNFAISGNAIDLPPTGELLITQYYEGSGINTDRWIEVTNISSNFVPSGKYYLALYKDTNATLTDGNLETSSPQEFIIIGDMAAGDVRLYSRTGAVLPLAGNRAVAITAEATEVCSFNGNDIILISTSFEDNCYNDRTDIMGVVQETGTPPNWGLDKSFIKGCGTTELPTITFSVATGPSGLLVTDYLEVSLSEVDNADNESNMALGIHESGTTTWTTSWDKGVPDKTRAAVIGSTFTYNASDGSFASCDLTVTGTLNMDGGTSNYVEVNKSLTITGTANFGDQESLYTVNSLDPSNIGGSPVTITGTITKYETTTELSDSNDYTYWSSPVEGSNMSTVFGAPTYHQSRLYYWNQAATNVIEYGGDEALGEWISSTGLTMKSGKGYISQGPQSDPYPADFKATVSFTGKPKTGSVNLSGDGLGNSSPTTTAIDVVFNNNGNDLDDLNLVGNPYPSAINADLFISNSNNAASINGTIWFWTHSTANNLSSTGAQYTDDDYASYNLLGGLSGLPAVSNPGGQVPSGIIGSGQGFMVQTNSNIEKITFTDKMRRKGDNTQFFRGVDTKSTQTDERDRIWLNVESSTGGAFSQILVGFIEDATDGFDRAYDGIKIDEGYINLYSKIDTLKYGIQGLSSFTAEKKVPLAFNTYIEEADVTYKISIDRFEGASLTDNDIYLVDNELNVTHDLKQGDYNFSAVTGYHDNRFTLQFTKATLGVDDFDLNNDFVVINEDDALLVKSKTIVKELKMYDVTGRLLVNMLPNESEFRVNTQNIRRGTVLILNTTFENGTEISKKAIKY